MPRVLTFDFSHPQDNLKHAGLNRIGHEADFAERFTETYQNKFHRVHSGTTKSNCYFAREVPVPGNGIPDLLVVSWNGDKRDMFSVGNLAETHPVIRAFEFKMVDWKKGLMQAHRYKYFSHAAILVMPRKKLHQAISKINMFRALSVGLWGFDPETDTISTFFTPRPIKQHIPRYRDIALQRVQQMALS